MQFGAALFQQLAYALDAGHTRLEGHYEAGSMAHRPRFPNLAIAGYSVVTGAQTPKTRSEESVRASLDRSVVVQSLGRAYNVFVS
jgi:hypothetical protein